ncbi:hypothetical protein [Polaromonas aquatica]|uniref:hypothetical protein n=1 Tax=Polaromonas aquatica TaxID=332657 RepID=UPI003D6617ED
MFDPSDRPHSPTSAPPPYWHHVTLAQLQRVKDWREAQRSTHPLECQLWEVVLTAWLLGWTGWLPAYAFEAVWAYPLCVLGILAPRLYVYARARAHAARRLRCDWLDLVT